MDQMTKADDDKGGIPNFKSFIHIHAGIDATGLPSVPSAAFYQLNGPSSGIELPRNIVLFSMPSLIDRMPRNHTNGGQAWIVVPVTNTKRRMRLQNFCRVRLKNMFPMRGIEWYPVLCTFGRTF